MTDSLSQQEAEFRVMDAWGALVPDQNPDSRVGVNPGPARRIVLSGHSQRRRPRAEDGMPARRYQGLVGSRR